MTTTSTAYPPEAFDKVLEAMERRSDCKGLGPEQVYAKLRAEGVFGKDAPPPKAEAMAAEAAREAPGPATTAQGLALPPARDARPAAAEPPRAVEPAPPTRRELPAPREQHAVARHHAAVGAGVAGLEDLDQGDVKIPTLKIRQSQAGKDGEGVPLGHLYLSFDPNGATAKRVIRILQLRKERSFMLPYGDSRKAAQERAELLDQIARDHQITVPAEAVSVCSSPDRVTPEDRGHGTLARSCAGCRYASWKTVKGKRQPPECAEAYLFLIYDETGGTPARLRLRGTAIAETKNLLTRLLMAAKKEQRPAGAYRFEFDTSKSKEGDWYVPRFGPLGPVNDEEIAQGEALRVALAGRVADEDEADAAPEQGA